MVLDQFLQRNSKLVFLGIIAFLSNAHATIQSFEPETNILFCDDLEDNEDKFYVPGTRGIGMKTCQWAKEGLIPSKRCKIEAVRANCPVFCRLKCAQKSDSPSIVPSTTQMPSISRSPSTTPTISQSPTISFYPSSIPSLSETPSKSPSMSPSKKMFCEDLQDNTMTFYVDGGIDTGMRSCQWASGTKMKQRCELEEVRENCPIICEIPCDLRTESPSDSPIQAHFKPDIAQAIVESDVNHPSKTALLTLGIIGAVILFVVVAASIGVMVDQDDEKSVVSSRKPVPIRFAEDLEMERKTDVVTIHEPVRLARPPSYIPANSGNLGLGHSAQDVHVCNNYPCDLCRNADKIKFIPVQKGWMKRRKKNDFSNNYDGSVNDIYLDDVSSEISDRIDSEGSESFDNDSGK